MDGIETLKRRGVEERALGRRYVSCMPRRERPSSTFSRLDNIVPYVSAVHFRDYTDDVPCSVEYRHSRENMKHFKTHRLLYPPLLRSASWNTPRIVMRVMAYRTNVVLILVVSRCTEYHWIFRIHGMCIWENLFANMSISYKFVLYFIYYNEEI